MLTPASTDPNFEREKKRRDHNPGSFGYDPEFERQRANTLKRAPNKDKR